ncbi:hypothetical protein NOVO_07110 [Rickettsiales bacterium Ac37b]|nr:hypothetical protein NOVO_07110 [Rickettsiales bacterium Ac37b]
MKSSIEQNMEILNVSLKEKADQDKNFLIDQITRFLKSETDFGTPLETDRDKINKAVENNNFTEALQNLEILREQKTGIKLIKIDGTNSNTPILIRDGRNNPHQNRILDTEGFEMQYLNVIRAAIEVVEIENKAELKDQLMKEAVKFINSFHKNNQGKSQEEISVNVKNKISNIMDFLEKNGIDEPYQKINIAKDFQNFNDEHFNIATLSEIIDHKGKKHTIVEAEVALKGITEEQKTEYTNRDHQKWFTKMPLWEQELVNRYVDKITEGNYVISTQLRQIVGMKNAFEKITAISDTDNKDFEILHSSKHAGTLASISRDNGSRQRITDLNAKQAQEWMGKDYVLHTNTLNSGSIKVNIPEQDAKIVLLTNRAMSNVGGIHTNTAFNKFRIFAPLNNLQGTKDLLNNLADNLPKEKEFEEIKAHLKPVGLFARLFNNKRKNDFGKLLNQVKETHNLSPNAIEILEIASDLRKNVEKADVFFLRRNDKNNISADISKKMNYLNNKILNSKDQILGLVPKSEVLTMCASGKDRTGLAEHDQTSWAIANKLKIDIKNIDQQILKSGHTAGQAGGVYSGGATIGCYGTLKVTSEGFPMDRRKILQPIMEVTAANNKIKALKTNKVINETQEQLIAQEMPNMYKNEAYLMIPIKIAAIAYIVN